MAPKSQAVKSSSMAMNMHNMGNTLMKSNQYKEAVDAYKESLRINPQDQDTRYNLAYALEKLKQQQQNKTKTINRETIRTKIRKTAKTIRNRIRIRKTIRKKTRSE